MPADHKEKVATATAPAMAPVLTVGDLKNHLDHYAPNATIVACGDRSHATCDVVTEILDSESVDHIVLATRHPNNINDDYPFQEPKIKELLERARRFVDAADSRLWGGDDYSDSYYDARMPLVILLDELDKEVALSDVFPARLW